MSDKQPRACGVAGCPRPYFANGYCNMHRQRVAKHGEPGQADKIRVERLGMCTVEGCNRPDKANGLCRMHYLRFWKHSEVREWQRPQEYHDPANDRLYHAWASMIQRCYNPKNIGYHNYGGRSITVCGRWRNSFADFYDDMGPRPEGKTLDRKDNDAHYSCGQCDDCKQRGWTANCRWATRRQQTLNRRLSKHSTSGYRGVSWHKQLNRWLARTGLADGGNIYIGCFQTPEEAANAYDQYAIQLFGDDARPNFEYVPVPTQ